MSDPTLVNGLTGPTTKTTRRWSRLGSIVLAGSLFLGACGSDEAADPTTPTAAGGADEADESTSTTASPAAPSTTTAPSTTVAMRSTESENAIRFSLDDGSDAADPAYGTPFFWEEGDVGILVSAPTQFLDFTDLDAVAMTDAPPTDLHTALSTPGMPAVSDPVPIEVGGIETVRFSQDGLPPGFAWTPTDEFGAFLTSLGATDCLGGQCLPIFVDGDGLWAAEPDLVTWYIPVTVNDRSLVIAASGAPGSSPDEIWTVVEPLLESLTWE